MTYDEISFVEMVNVLAKDGQAIIDSLTPEKMHILHMAIGIAGEAGELIDTIKKSTIYEKELDLENVIEELGDLEFYMQGLRYALGIHRVTTIEANKKKLYKRYAGQYSDKAAQERADKVEVVGMAVGEQQATGLVIDSTDDCESCQ